MSEKGVERDSSGYKEDQRRNMHTFLACQTQSLVKPNENYLVLSHPCKQNFRLWFELPKLETIVHLFTAILWGVAYG